MEWSEVINDPTLQNLPFKIAEKIELYLAKGATEVWIAYDSGKTNTFTHEEKIKQSKLAA